MEHCGFVPYHFIWYLDECQQSVTTKDLFVPTYAGKRMITAPTTGTGNVHDDKNFNNSIRWFKLGIQD